MFTSLNLQKTGIFLPEDIYNIVKSKAEINLEDKYRIMEKQGIKMVTIEDEETGEKKQC